MLVLDLAQVFVILMNVKVLVLVIVIACPGVRHGARIVLVIVLVSRTFGLVTAVVVCDARHDARLHAR